MAVEEALSHSDAVEHERAGPAWKRTHDFNIPVTHGRERSRVRDGTPDVVDE
jgi:hypothetical protein